METIKQLSRHYNCKVKKMKICLTHSINDLPNLHLHVIAVLTTYVSIVEAFIQILAIGLAQKKSNIYFSPSDCLETIRENFQAAANNILLPFFLFFAFSEEIFFVNIINGFDIRLTISFNLHIL